MATGTIKLGAYKKLSRNPLPGGLLEGFFYGGGEVNVGLARGRVPARKASARIGPKLVNVPQVETPARQHLIFYDIPSSKRVARCTNILPTGARLSGLGEGQRLRKGFHNGGVCETHCIQSRSGGRTKQREVRIGDCTGEAKQQVKLLPIFESLSSAAEIRLYIRETL